MNKSYDWEEHSDEPDIIKPSHKELQKRIFEMLGRKAVQKYGAEPELVDASTLRLGPCSGLDDNEDEFEDEA